LSGELDELKDILVRFEGLVRRSTVVTSYPMDVKQEEGEAVFGASRVFYLRTSSPHYIALTLNGDMGLATALVAVEAVRHGQPDRVEVGRLGNKADFTATWILAPPEEKQRLLKFALDIHSSLGIKSTQVDFAEVVKTTKQFLMGCGF